MGFLKTCLFRGAAQLSTLRSLKKHFLFLFSCSFLCFYTSSFADSTQITAIQPINLYPYIKCNNDGYSSGANIDAYNSTYFNSNSYPSSCWADLWGQGNALTTANATSSNPYQTYNDSWHGQQITVDGEYEIVATFYFQQLSTAPVYYWVDDWATNYNLAQSPVGGVTASTPMPEFTRIFFSGDVPYELNVGVSGTATVYFSGRAHLRAGSTVYYPRIWTQCQDVNSCNGSFQYLAGACGPAGSGTIPGSCFYITLVSTP